MILYSALCKKFDKRYWSLVVTVLRRPWWCRELRRPWQMDFGALASVPSARPLQPELLLPPQNFPGEVRGYQEPSGTKQTRQYKTRQERPPGPDRQDRTAHRNQKPPLAGLEAEASSGHDMTSGALTGSLSNCFHLHNKRSRLPQTSLRGQDKVL